MNADWQIKQELADRAIALLQVSVSNDSDYIVIRKTVEILNALRNNISGDAAEICLGLYSADELAETACELGEICLDDTADYYAVVDAVHIIDEVRKSLIEALTRTTKDVTHPV